MNWLLQEDLQFATIWLLTIIAQASVWLLLIRASGSP